MTAKRKLIYVSAGAGLGAVVSGLALIHEPSLHLLALGGIVLGAVVVFDWLLILTLPQGFLGYSLCQLHLSLLAWLLCLIGELSTTA
jgi:hypothetical protein